MKHIGVIVFMLSGVGLVSTPFLVKQQARMAPPIVYMQKKANPEIYNPDTAHITATPNVGQAVPLPKETDTTPSFTDITTMTRIFISISALLASLFIIIRGSASSPDATKWAIGTVGLIIGFWLK